MMHGGREEQEAIIEVVDVMRDEMYAPVCFRKECT